MTEPAHVRSLFMIWLVLTAGGIALAGVVWRRLPSVCRWLTPQPSRPAPWSAAEIYLMLVAYWFLPSLLYLGLSQTPFLGWVGVADEGAMGQLVDDQVKALRVARAQPWVRLACVPLFAAVLVLLTPRHSGTLADQLGLSRSHLGAGLGLGLLAALVCIPAVNAVYAAVTWAMLEVGHVAPEEHPLTHLARHGLTTAEWTALVCSAVLAAPILEEALFRGVLQRWLAQQSWGGDAAMGAAFGFAVLARWEPLGEAWARQSVAAFWPAAAPAFFVLALALPYLLVRRGAATPSPAALYGTAVLFAAVHAAVWPTPIPLFVLGLALGLLVHRTQSLVAPITVHALFNAVACGILLNSGR